jgi:urease gamma subunit
MYVEQLDIKEAEQLENLFESSALRFNRLKHNYFKNYINKTKLISNSICDDGRQGKISFQRI